MTAARKKVPSIPKIKPLPIRLKKNSVYVENI